MANFFNFRINYKIHEGLLVFFLYNTCAMILRSSMFLVHCPSSIILILSSSGWHSKSPIESHSLPRRQRGTIAREYSLWGNNFLRRSGNPKCLAPASSFHFPSRVSALVCFERGFNCARSRAACNWNRSGCLKLREKKESTCVEIRSFLFSFVYLFSVKD